MGINAITAHKLYRAKQRAKEIEVMKKECACPVYWELHHGILNYRTGKWSRFHKVLRYKTYSEAKHALDLIADYQKDNACYIVRRYGYAEKENAD